MSDTDIDWRQVDLLVAEHVLGLHKEILHPEWYRLPVVCFYEVGQPLITYTWDDNACNAMMYRNGVDTSDGTAPSLPGFSEEADTIHLLIDALLQRRAMVTLSVFHGQPTCEIANDGDTGSTVVSAPTLPYALCQCALEHLDIEIPMLAPSSPLPGKGL